VLVFGIVPALHGTRGELQDSLSEGRGATAGPGTLRLRSAVVVGELTLACALLVGAALLVRSFQELLRTDPGFRAAGVVTASVALPPRYADENHAARFWADLERRFAEVPGVAAVGVGSALPWTGYDENTGFEVVGEVKDEDQANARFASASSGYFKALGIPLRAGRYPAADDTAERPLVVVVNESLARALFPEGGALGRKLKVWGEEREIVGVVGDVRDAPDALTAVPALFWPVQQQPFPMAAVVVRSSGQPLELVGSLRATLAELDRELALADVRSMEEIADAALARRRFLLACVTGIAALALALAAVGAYGALAYAVEQRRRELGVRMALGAGRGRILGLVVGQGVRLAAGGVALGATAALVFGRLIAGQLYGITARDPWSFAGAALLVSLIAMVSSLLPALRAARAEPMSVLRAE
jgi:putative ABC transport system permease protein